MNIRNVVVSLAAAAAISPSISSASPESASLAACAQAFATGIASPGSAAPKYKVSYLTDGNFGNFSQIFAREFTFEMQAKDPKTGLDVATARCSASTEGVVTELAIKPLTTASRLAARN
ncbi:MAG: hypothetical protein WB440_01855 [Steroidobacteraceae bacterium]|jgi:hypothetical protein